VAIAILFSSYIRVINNEKSFLNRKLCSALLNTGPFVGIRHGRRENKRDRGNVHIEFFSSLYILYSSVFKFSCHTSYPPFLCSPVELNWSPTTGSKPVV
jgi:hypothetical protein